MDKFFVELERSIACHRPATRIVCSIAVSAYIVDFFEAFRHGGLHWNKPGKRAVAIHVIGPTFKTTLRVCAVVRDEHDQRVIELARVLKKSRQSSDLFIRMLKKTGEWRLIAHKKTFLVGGKRVPWLNAFVTRREFYVRGNNP